jgi:hypothetical protein
MSSREGLFMAGGLLAAVVGLQLTLGKPINPEEALLNPGTVAVFESDSGVPIHCRDVRDYQQCLAGHDRRGGPLVLLLGNSMLHAINQYEPGQLGAPLTLHRALRREGLDLLTFSYGNANIQEHAAEYVYLNGQRPVSILLVALVYDDTREDGVREDLHPFLADSGTRARLRKYDIGRQWTARDTATAARSEVSASVQDRVEKWLDARASAASVLWQQRSEIEYQYFVTLRRLRNQAFGVTPETRRKRIPAVYAKNMAALDMMLAEAAVNGTQVVLYIVPLRQDVAVPYVPEEYAEFKRDVQTAAAAHRNARYVDLDTIVPPALWGQKNSTAVGGKLELDFMHFTSAGHAILADRLLALVREVRANNAVQQP